MSASLRINYAECPTAPELIRAHVLLNGPSANNYFLDADTRGAEGYLKISMIFCHSRDILGFFVVVKNRRTHRRLP